MCRGVRGATTATTNTKESILEATKELLEAIISANEIKLNDVAATWLTTTSDLNAEFPAVAARQIGWTDIPLLCGHEMEVGDALEKCIRALVLVNTVKAQGELVHVYLRDAVGLRKRGTS